MGQLIYSHPFTSILNSTVMKKGEAVRSHCGLGPAGRVLLPGSPSVEWSPRPARVTVWGAWLGGQQASFPHSLRVL